MAGGLACDRLTDLDIALSGGGVAHLADFRGQKLIVHFCPAGATADLLAFDALRDDYAAAGAWLITADPADEGAYRALASYFPDFIHADPQDGATFVIERDGIPRYVWPGFGNAGEALVAVCDRP
jgi:peroxiredoxin